MWTGVGRPASGAERERVSPRVGRPAGPHPETTTKVLNAALELFLTEGADSLTPSRLSDRSGVGRATIYRHWPDKARLIADLLRAATHKPTEPIPLTDLRTDLDVAMKHLIARFNYRPVRAFFAACLDFGRRSEEVSQFAEEFISGMLRPFHAILEPAVARGELHGDVERLVDELTGPIMLRHVLRGRPVGPGDAALAVETFMARHDQP